MKIDPHKWRNEMDAACIELQRATTSQDFHRTRMAWLKITGLLDQGEYALMAADPAPPEAL